MSEDLTTLACQQQLLETISIHLYRYFGAEIPYSIPEPVPDVKSKCIWEPVEKNTDDTCFEVYTLPADRMGLSIQ